MSLELLQIPNYQSVWSFCHPRVAAKLAELPVQNKLVWSEVQSTVEKFRRIWCYWIAHSESLNFSGCEAKPEWAITNGIHEAIVHQLAYVRPKVKRFVTIVGDYPFYTDMLHGYPHSALIEEQIPMIGKDWYVLVSIPHHSGEIPPWFDKLVYYAEKNEFKIFLDCAFFGTIAQGVIDTELDCFDVVAFSLSKPFLCSGLRIGIAFGADLAPSLTIPMYPNFSYLNANGIRATNAILAEFPANFMPDLCRDAQLKICRLNNLEVCNIFMLGKSYHSMYEPLYRPGTNYIRFCLTPLIQNELGIA